MDHEVQHYRYIRTANAEKRESLTLDESRPRHVRQRSPHRTIEPLDVTDLHYTSVARGKTENLLRLLQRGRDGLLNEDMLACLERRTGDREMGRCRDDYRHPVHIR